MSCQILQFVVKLKDLNKYMFPSALYVRLILHRLKRVIFSLIPLKKLMSGPYLAHMGR